MRTLLLSLLSFALLLVVSGCQKNKFPTGSAEEAADAPAYTVQPDLNGGTIPVSKDGK